MKLIQAFAFSLIFTVGSIADAKPSTDKSQPSRENQISVTFSGLSGPTDALSLEFGVENTTSTGSGSGGGAGKATFKELVITRRVDSLSPTLFQKLVTGSHFESVIVTQGNLKISCNLVKLADYRIDAEAGPSGYQVETVVLSYAAVDMQVTP